MKERKNNTNFKLQFKIIVLLISNNLKIAINNRFLYHTCLMTHHFDDKISFTIHENVFPNLMKMKMHSSFVLLRSFWYEKILISVSIFISQDNRKFYLQFYSDYFI